MESPQPRWRRAQSDDIDALAALVNSAYRGDTSRRGWTTEADLLGGQRTDAESLRGILSSPDDVILLIEQEMALVGCVNLQRKRDHAYLGMLTVSPELQGSGTGRSLLELAEQYVLREWGLRKVAMTVIRQRPELIEWYERRGYRRTGRREPFPYGDPLFGLPRVEDLEFEVLEKSLPPASIAPTR